VYEAVGVFDLDDDSISVVVDIAAAPEERVLAAARKCPTKAITVRRDGAVIN
jgi:ferredoxin